MPSVSTVINNHIAVLIGNLFNVSGNKVSILMLMHYLRSCATLTTLAVVKDKPEKFRGERNLNSCLCDFSSVFYQANWELVITWVSDNQMKCQ